MANAKRKTKKQPTAMAAALQSAGVTGLASTGVPHAAIIDGALHNVDVVVQKSQTTPIISNPMPYIDELMKLDDYWGAVAQRTLTQNIGTVAVRAVMWEQRMRNAAPKVTSTIDAFNGMLADVKKKEFDGEVTKMQGNRNIPFIDGVALLGVYKALFIDACHIAGDSESKLLPKPAVLYSKANEKNTDEAAVEEACNTFQMERFKNSPVYDDVITKMQSNKVKKDARELRKAQDELDHIHTEIAHTPMVQLDDDDVWASVPLWGQYKWMLSVYRQTTSAIASELKKPATERDNFDALDDLAKTIRLELEAARRSEQVMLAFEKKILKPEFHELSSKKVITQ